MLSRRKSILHLGEGEWELEWEGRSDDDQYSAEMAGATIKALRISSGEPAEGLRILIQEAAEKGSNVVIKSSLKPRRSSKVLQFSNILHVELGFLKSCFLCKKHLSPHEDVFMYRGDQGFCSEECRCRQILLDERRELDLVRRPHRRAAGATGAKVHGSDRRQRKVLVVS